MPGNDDQARLVKKEDGGKGMKDCCKETIKKLIDFEHRRVDILDKITRELEEKPEKERDNFIRIVAWTCYGEEARKTEEYLRNILLGKIEL